MRKYGWHYDPNKPVTGYTDIRKAEDSHPTAKSKSIPHSGKTPQTSTAKSPAPRKSAERARTSAAESTPPSAPPTEDVDPLTEADPWMDKNFDPEKCAAYDERVRNAAAKREADLFVASDDEDAKDGS